MCTIQCIRNHRKLTLDNIRCVILCKICIRHKQRIFKKWDRNAKQVNPLCLQLFCVYIVILQ